MRSWRVKPLHALVMEILEKNGRMTDDKLLDQVRAYYPDVSMWELNRTLMMLEMNGYIYVVPYMRGRRQIEVRRPGHGR